MCWFLRVEFVIASTRISNRSRQLRSRNSCANRGTRNESNAKSIYSRPCGGNACGINGRHTNGHEDATAVQRLKAESEKRDKRAKPGAGSQGESKSEGAEAVIHRDGPDLVDLPDVRYCLGCHRNPVGCTFAYTSRIPSATRPESIGTFLSDWRRGDGCPLVPEVRQNPADCAAPQSGAQLNGGKLW